MSITISRKKKKGKNGEKMPEPGLLTSSGDELWQRIGHSVFIHVDLDAIASNIRVLKKLTKNENIGMIAVLKANAYGHGAVTVARYITEDAKVADRVAVVTISEGIELRRAGIELHTPIHVFGNTPAWAMPLCLIYSLIPTVANEQAIHSMSNALNQFHLGKLSIWNSSGARIIFDKKKTNPVPYGSINIKIDTGMSRNGCQPQELPKLIEACQASGVPIDAIFSHFYNHDESGCSEKQLKLFMTTIANYRKDGYKLHIANSRGVTRGLGTDLDFIRPGLAIYGLSPDSDNIDQFVSLGFRPALSIKATPTLVKKCPPGTKVGYASTYTCPEEQWIATIPIGFCDGFRRQLANLNAQIIRDKTGERCPVVGRVSMDAITVSLPCQPEPEEMFTIISADFDLKTSVYGIAKALGTIEHEVLTSLATRLPRVYSTSEKSFYAITGPHCLLGPTQPLVES